jgi:hypothetical protein
MNSEEYKRTCRTFHMTNCRIAQRHQYEQRPYVEDSACNDCLRHRNIYLDDPFSVFDVHTAAALFSVGILLILNYGMIL